MALCYCQREIFKYDMLRLSLVQEHEKKFVRPAMFREVYSRIQVTGGLRIN